MGTHDRDLPLEEIILDTDDEATQESKKKLTKTREEKASLFNHLVCLTLILSYSQPTLTYRPSPPPRPLGISFPLGKSGTENYFTLRPPTLGPPSHTLPPPHPTPPHPPFPLPLGKSGTGKAESRETRAT